MSRLWFVMLTGLYMQDDEGQIIGARVRDVLRKKEQNVYARQVSIYFSMHPQKGASKIEQTCISEDTLARL